MLDEDYIAKKAQEALGAYRKTRDYEHLIDLYYCAIVLLGEEIDFDITLAEFIERDLKLFNFSSN